MFSVLAVCAGACLGALGRWVLGLALNALFPAIPPGTLLANWLGSFLMGCFLAVALLIPLTPIARLFIVTGFLGSFTTFSAFSGEMLNLLLEAKYGLLTLGVAAHVGGSLLLSLTGFSLIRWLAKF